MIGQVTAPVAGQGKVVALAVLIGLFTLYVTGLDQGLLFSLVQGDVAYAQSIVHETLHDARHAAGFACH